MTSRAEPQRTCIGCRSRSPKRELIRLVRTQGTGVAIDISGAAHGRGGYVHLDGACVGRLHEKALARALRTGVGRNEVGKLRNELEERLGAS